MTTLTGSYQIHSEERGPHWIAWVSRDGSGKPDRSVIVVGENQEKAETNARKWAEQSSYLDSPTTPGGASAAQKIGTPPPPIA